MVEKDGKMESITERVTKPLFIDKVRREKLRGWDPNVVIYHIGGQTELPYAVVTKKSSKQSWVGM